MYNATPNMLWITLAVDPYYIPRKPSEARIPLATRITETRFRTLDHVSRLGIPKL